MFANEFEAAIVAVESMLLEVAGNPKAGNVDRDHDFEDLRYEHFIVSSVSSFPVFLDAAFNKQTAGKLVLEVVRASSKWHAASNVHFGAFLLLIPLTMAWNSESVFELAKNATEKVKQTDFNDSVAILKAFKLTSARVLNAEKLSLESDETERFLVSNNINVYEWMKLAPKENIIAKELTNSFKISLMGGRMLLKFFEEFKDVNTAIVLCYHSLLSKYVDPLVISKVGFDLAFEIKSKAESCLREFEEKQSVEVFRKLDDELISIGANPGTIADLTISSIFFALAEGWRF